MPLLPPTIDNRPYQQLLDEALARIPVHTPEWTNFNRSDPGVTLIEVFAFLTESLLYRSNLIPERNRVRFLQLLGVPLQPGAAARGLVTFNNARGPLTVITLATGLEVRAGQTPFRTTQGLDVLPIEAQLFYKRRVTAPNAQTQSYYQQLYAALLRPERGEELELYETTAFPPRDGSSVNLGQESVGGALWIALLTRPREDLNDVRRELGGRTLNLGFVPALNAEGRRLAPGGQNEAAGLPLLTYEMPIAETLAAGQPPRYQRLEAVAARDVLLEPGIVQLRLPAAAQLKLWDNLDPLSAGTGDFPPSLEDTQLNERLLTWVRVRAATPAGFQLLWAGINSTEVTQRAEVLNEPLPVGTGEPDQTITLAKTPIIPRSVRLTVKGEVWQEIDDLTAAGPEVPVADPRQSPGTPPIKNARVKVFRLNAESGEIFFGDGLRGARPPRGAVLRADYAYGVGRAGNVNAGAINNSPALPAGLQVSNPVATWGGADPETVGEGEKQITRYLQHRDRLVTAADFKTITRRTPGVEIGRVEVIPVWNPNLDSSEPGDAPGAVTLLVIPRYDPKHPQAPEPDRIFLNTICAYLDPRRLVTTEVFLRGPSYQDIWLAIGINVDAGRSIAEVTEAVRNELLRFLAPLPQSPAVCDEPPGATLDAVPTERHCGWPLQKPVVALELMARASRVSGVTQVNGVLLTAGAATTQDEISMRGLQLPRVAGISVTAGEPLALDQLRGTATAAADSAPRNFVPVPLVAEEC